MIFVLKWLRWIFHLRLQTKQCLFLQWNMFCKSVYSLWLPWLAVCYLHLIAVPHNGCMSFIYVLEDHWTADGHISQGLYLTSVWEEHWRVDGHTSQWLCDIYICVKGSLTCWCHISQWLLVTYICVGGSLTCWWPYLTMALSHLHLYWRITDLLMAVPHNGYRSLTSVLEDHWPVDSRTSQWL